MEGLNIGAILLGYLAILVLIGAVLVAFGFLIARWFKTARIVFSSGMMVAFVISALAGLSYLEPGMGFHAEGSELMIVIISGTLLIGGIGQFIGAVRNHRAFGLSVSCTVASVVPLMCLGMSGADFVGGLDLNLRLPPLVLPVIGLLLAFVALGLGIFVRGSRQSEDDVAQDEARP